MDIGTGCGVLGVSVLLQNPKWFSTAILTDYFADALEVAQKNVAHHLASERESVHLIQSDWLAFLYDTTWDVSHHHIVLVANLPYIPEETFEANAADNVKKREPKPAFVGGDDGLDYYKQMFHQLFSLIEN